MGFFSSIFSAIKEIISDIVESIATFLSDIFGSPIIAALAIFIVTWMIVGPGGPYDKLLMFLQDPLNYLLASPMLAAAAINVLLVTLAEVIPAFKVFLAKIMGFVSFLLLAAGVWYTLGPESYLVTAQWLGQVIGSFGLTVQEFLYWFEVVSTLTTINFVAGLAAGPDDEYVQAWVDGFTKVPEVVAEVLDTATSALTSTLGGWLVLAGLAYVGVSMLTSPSTTVRVETSGEA